MNKRQRKKKQKKEELFISSFVSSYRELSKEDRWYHEWMINNKRKRQITPAVENWEMLGFTHEEAIELTKLTDIFI